MRVLRHFFLVSVVGLIKCFVFKASACARHVVIGGKVLLKFVVCSRGNNCCFYFIFISITCVSSSTAFYLSFECSLSVVPFNRQQEG